jgi:dTDP-glucose 4,6-dehydratase
MKNVLFTGGCGFIGSNILNHFLQKYNDVFFINIDKLDYCSSTSNVDSKHENYLFVHGNICDVSLIKFLLKTYNIDTVIHLAAQTHVDNSFGNSLQFTEDNIKGTHVLLECAKAHNLIEKFIHMSTDEVYGQVDLNHSGCKETALLNPTNPYAATKCAAEFLCNSYIHSFKLPIIIVRCNNVYGPNQYPEKLIPKFIKHIQNNEKLPIQGTGEARRNFIHTSDVANAFDIILKKGILHQIYNIGSQYEYSVLDVAKMVINKYKPNSKFEDWITYVEDRNFNDFRYSVDTTKLTDLGWKILHEFNI